MPDVLNAIGNQALSAGLGMVLQGFNDDRQLGQQRRLLEQQYAIDNRMAESNYQRQLRMWKDTNFSAQVEQLKMAGLNPSLLYSKGGPGGVLGNATGSVHSAAAPVGGMEIMNMMATRANIDLIRAQTEKTKAEADAIPTTVEKTKAETASLTQGIKNQRAQVELMEVQRDIAEIEQHIKGRTQNMAIASAETLLRQATATMDMLERQNDIDAKTKQEKIDMIKTELAGMLIQNELQKQQITASKQQIMAMWAEIAQKTIGLSQTERQTVVQEKLAEISGGKLTLEKQQTMMRMVETIMNRLMPSATTVLNAIKPAL